jgi:V/A-type H+-transporting ATPase subunit A
MSVLEEEDRLREIVRLVGIDALSKDERMILETAKSIREDFLHQNAFHEIDTYASMDKQTKMLRTIMTFHDLCMDALKRGALLNDILGLEVREKIARMRYLSEDDLGSIDELEPEMKQQVNKLLPEGSIGDVA